MKRIVLGQSFLYGRGFFLLKQVSGHQSDPPLVSRMEQFQRYFDENRQLWNKRATVHVGSKFYDVPAFLAGKSSLCGIELEEMGDVEGKSILHLQCHFGLDTLSLARCGANVTGVDLSDTSIELARKLSVDSSLPANFVRCNIFDLPDQLTGKFDIVFTSFGVVGWLPDLNRWADVIAHFVKPDGLFYILEFHRSFMQFDEDGEVAYDYFYSETPDEETITTTYTDGPSHEPAKEYWWNHTTSDIFMALYGAKLQVYSFHEFPYSAYKLNNNMIEVEPNRWVHQKLGGRIPYMFSLKARMNESL